MARPLSEAARTKTLEAASAVLEELGVDGFTVDEVARRSKVAKSTIYRHFTSSDELLLCALDCMLFSLPTPNNGDLRADLDEFLSAAEEFMMSETAPRLLTGILNRSTNDPEFAKIHGAFMAQQRQPLKTMVQLAQARGEVHPDLDLDIAVDIMEGPFMMQKLVRRQPMTTNTAKIIMDLALAGLLNYEPS